MRPVPEKGPAWAWRSPDGSPRSTGGGCSRRITPRAAPPLRSSCRHLKRSHRTDLSNARIALKRGSRGARPRRGSRGPAGPAKSLSDLLSSAHSRLIGLEQHEAPAFPHPFSPDFPHTPTPPEPPPPAPPPASSPPAPPLPP